jgi:pyridoxamine 5'-phosphate oxidase
MTESLGPEPLQILGQWYREAAALGEELAEAVALATVSAAGQPRCRMVLWRGVEQGSLTFFTNYESRKAAEIEHEPRVALTFHFRKLERQVRVEGTARRANEEVSDAYFAQRPRDSQLSAWASPQSSVLTGRAELEARYREAEQRFGQGVVERPPFWGGYEVEASRIEFWLGRASRLHDRFCYERLSSGLWGCTRLAP